MSGRRNGRLFKRTALREIRRALRQIGQVFLVLRSFIIYNKKKGVAFYGSGVRGALYVKLRIAKERIAQNVHFA